MEKPPVVAVINSTEDIVDLLRIWIEQAGFVVVGTMTSLIRDGEVDVEQFIGQHDPLVIVYDISPPYEPNWRLFQHVASLPVMAGRQVVLTSTNARQVEKLAGLQVPERAEYIRVITAELTRLLNHTCLAGFLLQDMGALGTPASAPIGAGAILPIVIPNEFMYARGHSPPKGASRLILQP